MNDMTMNYFERKKQLVSVFRDTMSRVKSDPELQLAVKDSIAKQIFVPEGERIEAGVPRYVEPAKVLVTHNRSFEAVANYRGQKVTVLNFASSTSPGGGVETGASAQEECLCRVSTLYPCLKDKAMWERFYAPHRAARNPLHNDDIIYTPGVVVIKDDDYNLLSEPFVVDVITCAAPNLYEYVISPETLFAIHERRARRIMAVAAQNGAEVLILGAFGCGAFRNDPNVVASAYQLVVPELLSHFSTVEFAVYTSKKDQGNYLAFKHLGLD